MSGINLMGQLGKNRKNQSYTVKRKTRRSGGLGKKFKLPSFGSGNIDHKKLILFLLVLCLIYGAKLYMDNERKKKLIVERVKLQNIQKKIEQEKRKSQALDEITKAMEDYEKRVSELRQKLGVFEKLRKNRNLLVRMVDYAVSEMPDDIWLTTLNTDRERAEITINGFSSTHQKLSEYLAKLGESIFYPTWTLKFIENTPGKAPAGNSQIISTPANSKKFSILSKITEPN